MACEDLEALREVLSLEGEANSGSVVPGHSMPVMCEIVQMLPKGHVGCGEAVCAVVGGPLNGDPMLKF